jgi:aspartate racemase
MRKYARKLGILGGMGPEATAALYLGIIYRCQRELRAKYNSDFPTIIINSSPAPDGRMWKGFNKTEVEASLRKNTRILERAGADFIAIPCNSAHHFLPTIRKSVRIPVLSIVEETARQVKLQGLRRVLLLATTFTANQRVYDEVLSKNDIDLLKPNIPVQRLVEQIIIRVESGKRRRADKNKMIRIINHFRRKASIDGVVAGCTEIPLLLHQTEVAYPLLDTIDILASSSYQRILGKRALTDIGRES